MHPIILGISIPSHKPGKAPDHKFVGNKLDELLKQHFMGQKLVIRCIGSQDHSGLGVDELAKIICKTGTDKYDSTRRGFGYDGFAGKEIKGGFLRRAGACNQKWHFYATTNLGNASQRDWRPRLWRAC